MAPTSQSTSAAASSSISKSVQGTLKDVTSRVRAALVSDSTPLQPALSSIDLLVSDVVKDHPRSVTGSLSQALAMAAHPSTAAPAPSSLPPVQPGQPSNPAVAELLSTELLHIYEEEMDQHDLTKLSALVAILHRVVPLFGSECIILTWWDLVLRPVLKNTRASQPVTQLARELVVLAMSDAAPEAYNDELEYRPGPSLVSAVAPPSSFPAPTPATTAGSEEESGLSSDEHEQPAEDTGSRSARPSPSKACLRATGDKARKFTQRILDMFLSETSPAVHSPGSNSADDDAEEEELAEMVQDEDDGDGGAAPQSGREHQRDSVAEEELATQTWRGNLENILLMFGKKKPKANPAARVPILVLLTHFVRLHSMHAHQITSTRLLSVMLLSLQLDTSATAISLGITALIMLMPHIPIWLAAGSTNPTSSTDRESRWGTLATPPGGWLAQFFSIFGRVVDWRPDIGQGWEQRLGEGEKAVRERRERDEDFAVVSRMGKRLEIRPEIGWTRLDSSFDTTPLEMPNVGQFFTFLYGLFPCNLIRFLRTPFVYLREAGFDSPTVGHWEDMMDEDGMRARSVAFLRRHSLHPSLVLHDAKSELNDRLRWSRSDTADIVTECIGLYFGSWGDRPMAATDCEAVPADDSVLPGPGSEEAPVSPMSDSAMSKSAAVADLRAGSMRTESDADVPWTGHSRQSSVSAFAPATPQFVTSSSTPPQLLWRSYSGFRRIVNEDDILSTYAALRSGVPVALEVSSPMEQVHAVNSEGRRVTLAALSLDPPELYQPLTAPLSGSQTPRVPTSHGSADVLGSAMSSPRITAATPHRRSVLHRGRSGSLSSPFHAQPLSALGSPLKSPSVSSRKGLSSGLTPTLSPMYPNVHVHSIAPISTFSPPLRPARTRRQAHLTFMQRENLLLRNELNFELYLKEQHLRHIGRLHRDRMADSAVEAERQNLQNTNRLLRSQLSAAQASLERQRSEAASTKAMHVKWENELNAKLKVYREERNSWTHEARELRATIEENEATIASQTKHLAETGAKLFELETHMTQVQPKVQKITEYEAKIQQLMTSLSYWDEDVRKYEEQKKEMEILISNWRKLEMLLQSMEDQLRTAHKAERELRARVHELEAETAAAKERASHKDPSVLNVPLTMPSETELEERRGREQRLRERNEELEATVLNLRARIEELELARTVASRGEGALAASGRASAGGEQDPSLTFSASLPAFAYGADSSSARTKDGGVGRGTAGTAGTLRTSWVSPATDPAVGAAGEGLSSTTMVASYSEPSPASPSGGGEEALLAFPDLHGSEPPPLFPHEV